MKVLKPLNCQQSFFGVRKILLFSSNYVCLVHPFVTFFCSVHPLGKWTLQALSFGKSQRTVTPGVGSAFRDDFYFCSFPNIWKVTVLYHLKQRTVNREEKYAFCKSMNKPIEYVKMLHKPVTTKEALQTCRGAVSRAAQRRDTDRRRTSEWWWFKPLREGMTFRYSFYSKLTNHLFSVHLCISPLSWELPLQVRSTCTVENVE